MRANRRIVDQTINRPKVFAQLFRQTCQVFNITQIEWAEMQWPWIGFLGFPLSQLEFIIALPRNGKDAIALFGKLSYNAQAKSAASACHDYVTH